MAALSVPKQYVTPEQLTVKYNEIMLTQKEKPHTFNFEKSAEQNYNMIDGVVNNRAVPEADLTDGQTHEEMRELAPETLPENKAADEKPSVMDEIKAAQKVQREQPQTPKPGLDRKKSDPEL